MNHYFNIDIFDDTSDELVAYLDTNSMILLEIKADYDYNESIIHFKNHYDNHILFLCMFQ